MFTIIILSLQGVAVEFVAQLNIFRRTVQNTRLQVSFHATLSKYLIKVFCCVLKRREEDLLVHLYSYKSINWHLPTDLSKATRNYPGLKSNKKNVKQNKVESWNNCNIS